MEYLVKRIKDLDGVLFQNLCFHIMSARYPTANIRYPEGAAGDEGVDLFRGDLTEGSTVWQCKAFSATILGASQKQQIKASLRKAVKKVKPKVWILCVNCNLDVKSLRWFQKLQKSYQALGISIADPVDAITLSKELMFRRIIRDEFFPSLALDVPGIKSLLMAAASGMKEVGVEDLEKLATENTEEYLDRLRNRDSRFTYEVTFGGERGPKVFPPKYEPELLVAMTDGRKIVKAFARDFAALANNPVSSEIEFSESGVQKLHNLIRTGRAQTWHPDEIQNFTSTMPLLSGMKFTPGSLTITAGGTIDEQIIPLKLIFSVLNQITSLDYVEFKKVRSGTDEAEITVADSHPLGLTFIFPSNTTSSITANLSPRLPGQSIHKVKEACAVFRMLKTGCMLEIVLLKAGGHLCTLEVEPVPIPFTERLFRFVEDLAAIAKRFAVDIPMPPSLTLSREDEEAFLILRSLTRQEPLELSRFTPTFVKCVENADLIPIHFRDIFVLRIDHSNSTASLLGVQIEVGPMRIQIDRAEVDSSSTSIEEFTKARLGTNVSIPLRPLTPVRFEMLDREALSPATAGDATLA